MKLSFFSELVADRRRLSTINTCSGNNESDEDIYKMKHSMTYQEEVEQLTKILDLFEWQIQGILLTMIDVILTPHYLVEKVDT